MAQRQLQVVGYGSAAGQGAAAPAYRCPAGGVWMATGRRPSGEGAAR